MDKTHEELDRELDDLLHAWEDEAVGSAEDAPTLQGGHPTSLPSLVAVATGPRVTVLERTASKYSFPRGVKFGGWSQADLDRFLDRLCNGVLRSTGRRREYVRIRRAVCLINLAMNRLQVRPPAFRHSRKVQPIFGSDELGMATLANDKKIIDLHWLFSQGVDLTLSDNQYRDLLRSQVFDFEMAERFAVEAWRTEARVGIIDISPYFEWQLDSLVSKKEWARRKVIDMAARGVRRKLRDEGLRSQRLHPDDAADFTELWIADQVCSGEPQGMIAKHHAWQRGRAALSATTISQKLKKMRRWVAK